MQLPKKLKSNLKLFNIFLLILTTISCFKKKQNVEEIETQKKFFSILFSNNINGETHPCGCRQFPLGGLPQVAGLIHKLSKESELFYVDSGDMLYPNSNLPEAYQKSHFFTAQKLIKAQSLLGLKFFTPGDYDLTEGIKNFSKVLSEAQFQVLLTNITKDFTRFPTLSSHQVKIGNHHFIFLGVSSPQVINSKLKNSLLDPIQSVKNELQKIKRESSNKITPTIIVLSHSGLDFDKIMAKEIPEIDWIIGSHSQSFLQKAEVVGKTQLVQVLSRNHYLGEIRFSLEDNSVSYQVHEVSEELSKELSPNPFQTFIDEHKKELSVIQEKEQKEQFGDFASKGPAPTAISCLECHKKQYNFWQSTAHSLAYVTLHQASEQKNRNCIGCHSLHFEKENGFYTQKQMIKSSNQNFDHEKYWKDFSFIFSEKNEIRKLTPEKRKELTGKWQQLDLKNQVSHNYANVQCLNCHTKNSDHPFDVSGVSHKTPMKIKCLSCHTKDQSPQWYQKDEKGLAGELDGQVFESMLQKVACPKGE